MLNDQLWKEVEALGKLSCGQFGFVEIDHVFTADGLPIDLHYTKHIFESKSSLLLSMCVGMWGGGIAEYNCRIMRVNGLQVVRDEHNCFVGGG